MIVLNEVTGERFEIEKRVPSTKPQDLPTVKAWDDGRGASKRNSEGLACGGRGN